MERPNDLPTRLSKEDWEVMKKVRTKLFSAMIDVRFSEDRKAIEDLVIREVSRRREPVEVSTISEDVRKIAWPTGHVFLTYSPNVEIIPMGVIEWE